MKTKIVHFISTLKDGGAQTQLILLCNNVNLEKYEVYIVCWDQPKGLSLRDEITIVELKRGSKYALFGFFRQVVRVTKKLKPDLVHLWLPEILTFPAAVYSKYNSIPTISAERGLPVEKISKLWFRDRLNYMSHFMADCIITNFPIPIKRRSFFNLLLHKKKTKTIYNGLDIDSLASLKINCENKPDDLFHLVYAGRLIHQKNVNLLIEAVSILSKRGLQIRLDIFGNGEKEGELKSMVRAYQLEGNIKFHGYNDNWKEIARYGHCFILPSNREGMPNVLFEAVAIGLPIISTNIEEIAIHFKNDYDAVLIPPNDLQSIVFSLERVIPDPRLLRKIKTNAFETIKKYTVKAMVNSYEEVYSQLLKGNKNSIP